MTIWGYRLCALGQLLGIKGGKGTDPGPAFHGWTFQSGTQMQRKCHEGPDGEDKMLLSQSFSKQEQGQRFLEAVTLGLRPKHELVRQRVGKEAFQAEGRACAK